MQNRSKAPIVLAALLFILAAVAEIVTSHTVMVDGAPAPVEHHLRINGHAAFPRPRRPLLGDPADR